MIGSARCAAFRTREGRKLAAKNLVMCDINCLVRPSPQLADKQRFTWACERAEEVCFFDFFSVFVA